MSIQTRDAEAQSLIRADTPYPAVLLIGRLDAGAGGVASFDFQAIPATFSSLMLICYLRSTKAATSSTTNLTFNGDAGNNYDSLRDRFWHTNNTGTGEQLAAAYMLLGSHTGGTGPASAFDALTAHIPAYANTGGHKVVTAEFTLKTVASTGNISRGVVAGWWRSTAAIERITLVPDANSWAEYSTARLYGVY